MHHLLSLTLMILFILLSNTSVHGASLPLAWMSDRDGDVDVYLWDGEKAINVSQNDATDEYMSQSSDGQLAWLNVMEDRTDVVVWDGETTINVSGSPKRNFMPVWSNDGRLAWWSEQNDDAGFSLQLAVWDGEQTILMGRDFGWTDFPFWNSGYGFFKPFWSDDGLLAWYAASGDGAMSMFVWDGEHITEVMSGMDRQALYPTWSPQGDLAWVAIDWAEDYSSAVHNLMVWDGEQTHTLIEQSDWGLAWAWSADGRLAFTGGDAGESLVGVWDGITVTAVNPSLSGDVSSPLWSADGSLTWQYTNEGTSSLYLWDGVNAVMLTGAADLHAWSLDGRLAWMSNVDGDFEIYVWDGEDTINISQQAAESDVNPQWLDNGRMLWQSGDWDQLELHVWDGTHTVTITSQPGVIYSMRQHGDLLVWIQQIDGHTEIYAWDGEKTFNLSDNPTWDAFQYPMMLG